MTHRDEGYDQTERIRFGWPERLILLGFLIGLCVVAATGCAAGPIRRALDKELGVLCYYTNTAMSCIPVNMKDRTPKSDTASIDNKPAGPAGR